VFIAALTLVRCMKPATHPGPPVFNTTRWSVVESAGAADSKAASAALEQLCKTYWSPVYAYARCFGSSPDDALDLTQGFFEKVIAGGYFAQADRSRGRFRSFLLASLKHFILNQHAKEKAVRRGGRMEFIPFDQSTAETRFKIEPVDRRSPDRAFERQWALALLEEVMESLRAQYSKAGETRLFDALQPCLATGRDRLSYAELGAGIGLSEGAVKVAVHRLRKRYRELLRQKVADTVSGSDVVEAELRYLFQALADP
jgi:RNA polymerase sigma-70 factor (ECF subfamily)